MTRLSLLFFALLLISSCATYNNPYYKDLDVNNLPELPDETPTETLIVIGDAGDDNYWKDGYNPALKLAESEIELMDENSTVVFVGDNIYPVGLEAKNHPRRKISEAKINSQLDILKNHKGKSYFIPGNHDWNRMAPGGLKSVRRQEKYIEDYYSEKGKAKFYPSDGCGDPVLKKKSKDLVYIFIDTQWYLHNWDGERGINRGCEAQSRREFLDLLKAMFLEHKNDQVVVFLHHPFYSNGEHGGNFSIRQHLFPLTDINKNLFIPLPVIGSLAPLYRSTTGSRQDIPNVLHQELKNELEDMISQNKHVIFAAGHEHSLQYFEQNDHHFIVTGSGSKKSYAKRGGEAEFVYSVLGYSKLYFYDDGEVWLEFKSPASTRNDKVIFRKRIVEPRAGTEIVKTDYPEKIDPNSFEVKAANVELGAGKLESFLLGSQYRDTWTTPVKVRNIDLTTEKGGLIPIKKGGGLASNSLRLENPETEDQYILRSINKDFTKLVPKAFRKLKALNILKDQNSASHPYGAMVLPKLSEAANIYYTQPELVNLKKQEALKAYNFYFNEELYLLEERPDGNRNSYDNFGNSEKIISYLDLLQKMRDDNDEFTIDQEWTLRSRLFDIWVHDWDRHDDQWRWAEFKDDDGNEFYRPIPRDRDQAFYKMKGLIPGVIATMFVKKFRPMRKDLKRPHQHCFNARYFDRYFLNEMTWQDWQQQVQFIQSNLTDEVIEEALRDLPQEVYELSAPEIKEKLLARRSNLLKIAKRYYKFLNKEVDVVGSHKEERFEVTELPSGNLLVEMYDLSKKGKKDELLYSREFDKDITNEIRLFGLGKKDEFKVSRKKARGIKVRIIGGYGKDRLFNNDDVSSLVKRTIVYDEPEGIVMDAPRKVNNRIDASIESNEYDRKEFKYNNSLTLPILGYTPDDKFWFGASNTTTTHGFRKDPYKSSHNVSASLAPGFGRTAFNLSYTGDYIDIISNKFDFAPSIELMFPWYQNFFGLGNSSIQPNREVEFNWVRLEKFKVTPAFKKNWDMNRIAIRISPTIESYKVEITPGRIIEEIVNLTPGFDLDRKTYLGAEASFHINAVDDEMNPNNGIRFNTYFNYKNEQMTGESIRGLGYNLSLYFTLGSGTTKATIANRIGMDGAYGDVPFYLFPNIGNTSSLRGFRNERFRGNRTFYHNIDVRFQLFKWDNRILPMDIGLLGGFDYGRVHVKKTINDKMYHKGYTAGIFFNVLSSIVVNPHMSFSKEEKQFNFRLGFSF